MKKMLLVGTFVLLGTAGLARADGPNPIELRQAGLDLLAGDFAAIRTVVAAKGDLKGVESAAKAIQRWAALMPELFPAGSDKGPTKAAPEVWSDNAGFVKAAAALGDAAGKLAAMAKAGDEAGLEAQVKLVGAACGACHKDYRQK
jgi:cytochrome c556